MTAMLDRVAKAMERARNTQWTDDEFDVWWNHDPYFCEAVTSWGYFTGTRKNRCLFEARVALQAARDATEPMIEAGCDYDERALYLRLGRPPTPEECQADEWAVMIDAALTE